MYLGSNLKKYPSKSAYVNDKDLDQDLVLLYLWKGERMPQNEQEKKWKAELDEIKRNGQVPEFYFE